MAVRPLSLFPLSLLTTVALAQTQVYSNAAPRATSVVIPGSDTGAPTLVYWGGWTTDGTRLINFGGRGVSATGGALSTYYNSLDAYDPLTNTWTNLSAQGDPTAPSSRFRPGCAYDPVGNRVVVFGGRASATGTIFADGFAFDLNTNTWSSIPNPTPGTTGPSARFDAQMSYDAATGSLLLFGGQFGTTTADRIDDTWLLNGTTWVPMNPTTSPSARGVHAMAARSAPHNDIVMVGGKDTANASLDDTWRWDGSILDWVQITPINNTVPVTFCGGNGMVYDSVRDVLVIINGPATGVAPSTSGATWTSEYDCVKNEWRAFGNNPASQSTSDPVIGQFQRFAVAFLNGKTYHWGGQNGGTSIGNGNLPFVREYQADPIATATTYGSGCTGQGAGDLTLTPDSAPWTGRTWSATCTNLGANTIAVEVWGFSTAATDLTGVLAGWTSGCLLLNTAEAIPGGSLPVAGVATISLQIPYNPAIAGAALNAQIIEWDIGANSFAGSNGVALTIGAL